MESKRKEKGKDKECESTNGGEGRSQVIQLNETEDNPHKSEEIIYQELRRMIRREMVIEVKKAIIKELSNTNTLQETTKEDIREEVRNILRDELGIIKSSKKKNGEIDQSKTKYEVYGQKKKYCQYCDKFLTYYSYSPHINSKRHKLNAELYDKKTLLERYDIPDQ